jgi:hypothetical protein
MHGRPDGRDFEDLQNLRLAEVGNTNVSTLSELDEL